MADGRGRMEWAQTSAVMALLANVNRDPKKTRAFKPDDFNPYTARHKRSEAIEITDMGVLKEAFTNQVTGSRPQASGTAECQSLKSGA